MAHGAMTEQSSIDVLRVRLEAAMKHRNASAKGLAKAAGLGETVVRDILQGHTKDVKLGTVEKLAKVLGLSLTELLPDAFDRIADRQPVRSDHPPLISAQAGDGAIAIRQVDIGYAMGAGSEIADYPDEMPVLFDAGFLASLTRAEPDCLYLARGDGDSMFPTIINQDQVIIDTSQRRLELQDRIWAVSVHGAGMIKRLRTIGPNRVRIISDNALVPPEEVDASDIHIAGRVVWIGRKV